MMCSANLLCFDPITLTMTVNTNQVHQIVPLSFGNALYEAGRQGKTERAKLNVHDHRSAWYVPLLSVELLVESPGGPPLSGPFRQNEND